LNIKRAFPSLKGTDIERHIKVNRSQDHSPYSVIFLARIACRYVAFELSTSMLEQTQALLLDYFDQFEREGKFVGIPQILTPLILICQRIGLPPISIIGFGRAVVSSDIRVPRPPAGIAAFIFYLF
jgi:hypothetical protein